MRFSATWASQFIVLVGLTLAGCDSSPVAAPFAGQLGVTVQPKVVAVDALGDTIAVAAQIGGSGAKHQDPVITWLSLDPTVAAVHGAGNVVALKTGSARVVARLQTGAADTAIVTVTQSPASITVRVAGTSSFDAASSGLFGLIGELRAINDSLRLEGVVHDRRGNRIPSARTEWMALDESVAGVTQFGTVYAKGSGSARIVGKAGQKADTVIVNVSQTADRVQVSHEQISMAALADTVWVSLQAWDRNGNAIAAPATDWRSTDQSVAAVTMDGRIIATGNGSARVIASSGGLADTVAVTVWQVAASLAVTPVAPTITGADSLRLSAAAYDARGNVMPAGFVAWSTSNDAVAKVDAAGRVWARSDGSATITAARDGKLATTMVTVLNAPTRVVIQPRADTLRAIGATARLTASAYDGSGNVIAGITMVWTSLSPGTVSVDGSGNVTARGIGTALIVAATACCSGADTVAVNVRPAVATVDVTPASVTLAAGSAQQLVATARDAAGNVLTGRRITWQSSNSGAVAVDTLGRASAVAAGTAQISAVVEGRAGTAMVNVQAQSESVARVVLDAAVDTLNALGASRPHTAVAYSSNNIVVPNTAFSWTSLAPAVATVDATGRVTAVTPGTARIVVRATCCSAADTLNVVVRQVVTSVTLTPTTATLLAGATLQLQAAARDANNHVVPNTSFTWTSSAPAIVSVSSAGLVGGVVAGNAVVTARSGTLQATSSIVVSANTDVGVPLFSDGFETGSRGLPANGIRWKGTPTNVTITNAIARSGAFSMRFRYAAKADCTDGSVEQRFELGTQRREIWLEYWIYLPDGSEGLGARWFQRSQDHCEPNSAKDDSKKFLALWSGEYNDTDNLMVILGLQRHSDISSYLSISAKNGTRDAKPLLRVNQVNDFITPATLGRWTRFRIYYRTADVNQSNGILRIWKDDALVAQNTDLPLFAVDPLITGITEGYLWGWTNAGYAEETSVFVDDFKIYNSNPNWQ
jgi:uncharacterized protein YjdB